MFGRTLFAWVRPSPEAPVAESTWNPTSLEMQEPRRIAASANNELITEQPRMGEPMVRLRGGGEGEDVCGCELFRMLLVLRLLLRLLRLLRGWGRSRRPARPGSVTMAL
ncbi:uncharacterized protein BO95DRAFT_468215 [Aspergillus brunneoviolaceus CBS 621.78]|uniref:Uncharacterized protein n=1 Tax=Aspergillus brunneoviolaceus CBS 621.78 TaxID=1450534 RepID=A0ACD1FVP0_9EURO|nr:hypothetical protein BO95DRAFT_468215 [Aspergillus brunneoviolaceus CBS 621.78]RAH41029.1 hypothetical protein BO95DRAFT_468215 [Aspergillus brunneoviolaceus CBS 621.78]